MPRRNKIENINSQDFYSKIQILQRNKILKKGNSNNTEKIFQQNKIIKKEKQQQTDFTTHR